MSNSAKYNGWKRIHTDANVWGISPVVESGPYLDNVPCGIYNEYDMLWRFADGRMVALKYPDDNGCPTCGYGSEAKWWLWTPAKM